MIVGSRRFLTVILVLHLGVIQPMAVFAANSALNRTSFIVTPIFAEQALEPVLVASYESSQVTIASSIRRAGAIFQAFGHFISQPRVGWTAAGSILAAIGIAYKVSTLHLGVHELTMYTFSALPFAGILGITLIDRLTQARSQLLSTAQQHSVALQRVAAAEQAVKQAQTEATAKLQEIERLRQSRDQSKLEVEALATSHQIFAGMTGQESTAKTLADVLESERAKLQDLEHALTTALQVINTSEDTLPSIEHELAAARETAAAVETTIQQITAQMATLQSQIDTAAEPAPALTPPSLDLPFVKTDTDRERLIAVGNAIRQLVGQDNLTQQALADLVGIPKGTLTWWLNDKKAPRSYKGIMEWALSVAADPYLKTPRPAIASPAVPSAAKGFMDEDQARKDLERHIPPDVWRTIQPHVRAAMTRLRQHGMGLTAIWRNDVTPSYPKGQGGLFWRAWPGDLTVIDERIDFLKNALADYPAYLERNWYLFNFQTELLAAAVKLLQARTGQEKVFSRDLDQIVSLYKDNLDGLKKDAAAAAETAARQRRVPGAPAAAPSVHPSLAPLMARFPEEPFHKQYILARLTQLGTDDATLQRAKSWHAWPKDIQIIEQRITLLRRHLSNFDEYFKNNWEILRWRIEEPFRMLAEAETGSPILLTGQEAVGLARQSADQDSPAIRKLVKEFLSSRQAPAPDVPLDTREITQKLSAVASWRRGGAQLVESKQFGKALAQYTKGLELAQEAAALLAPMKTTYAGASARETIADLDAKIQSNIEWLSRQIQALENVGPILENASLLEETELNFVIFIQSQITKAELITEPGIKRLLSIRQRIPLRKEFVNQLQEIKQSSSARPGLAAEVAKAVRFLIEDSVSLRAHGKEFLDTVRSLTRDTIFGWALHDQLFPDETAEEALRNAAKTAGPSPVSFYSAIKMSLPTPAKLDAEFKRVQRARQIAWDYVPKDEAAWDDSLIAVLAMHDKIRAAATEARKGYDRLLKDPVFQQSAKSATARAELSEMIEILHMVANKRIEAMAQFVEKRIVEVTPKDLTSANVEKYLSKVVLALLERTRNPLREKLADASHYPSLAFAVQNALQKQAAAKTSAAERRMKKVDPEPEEIRDVPERLVTLLAQYNVDLGKMGLAPNQVYSRDVIDKIYDKSGKNLKLRPHWSELRENTYLEAKEFLKSQGRRVLSASEVFDKKNGYLARYDLLEQAVNLRFREALLNIIAAIRFWLSNRWDIGERREIGQEEIDRTASFLEQRGYHLATDSEGNPIIEQTAPGWRVTAGSIEVDPITRVVRIQRNPFYSEIEGFRILVHELDHLRLRPRLERSHPTYQRLKAIPLIGARLAYWFIEEPMVIRLAERQWERAITLAQMKPFVGHDISGTLLQLLRDLLKNKETPPLRSHVRFSMAA